MSAGHQQWEHLPPASPCGWGFLAHGDSRDGISKEWLAKGNLPVIREHHRSGSATPTFCWSRPQSQISCHFKAERYYLLMGRARVLKEHTGLGVPGHFRKYSPKMIFESAQRQEMRTGDVGRGREA